MTADDMNQRRYWLWVTHPEYYWDENRNDRVELDPNSGIDTCDWWTCHKDTKAGDLALLYRTAPKSDVGYLLQVESDAYLITDEAEALEQGWVYACDYRSLYKFQHPVTFGELRDNHRLDEWGALRRRFEGSVFLIPSDCWAELNRLAADKNPNYQEFMENVKSISITKRKRVEQEMEEALVNRPGLLKRFGYDLELIGQQYVCKGNGGRIDLLFYDRKATQYVVVELKAKAAGQDAFAQISNYIGWVIDRIAGDSSVIGLVISRGYDVRFESCLKTTERVFHLDSRELGFE